MELLKSVLSIKTVIIILILVTLAFVGVTYTKANGSNLAWCFANINSCRIARVQALERDVRVLDVSK